jgi:uncharacterized protein (DUF362 family)
MKQRINRRQFLKLLGLSGLSLFLNKCGLGPVVTPEVPTFTPTSTIVPASTPTSTVEQTPTPTPTLTPSPSVTPSYAALAAIGEVVSYDKALIRRELEIMLDGLGGLHDIVKSGARVGIKANLTGTSYADSNLPAPSTELFVTHPIVVQALAELLIDAGAAQVSIMDGLGDETIFRKWGYAEIAAPLNARLVDLCKTSPYLDYVVFPVGEKRRVYDVFYMNAALSELDVFISVAKMKVHSTTGVTLALKNLIGIAPINLYRRTETDNHRSAFHESTTYDRRLPGVVIDLNLARPVHFALIDGIITAEGGAGSWDSGYNRVTPGLLVASKTPLAADAVATAIMGFEPDAPSGTHPFSYADNHLNLAREAGLGTNHLSEIGVVGPQITEVVYPFKPAR